MKSYSEDLRKKIVAAVERGISKSEAARLFDVSLSSVKRYSRMADGGVSLAPKKRPGRTPKVDEIIKGLLNEDMKERKETAANSSPRFIHCPKSAGAKTEDRSQSCLIPKVGGCAGRVGTPTPYLCSPHRFQS
jgi:predicted transcriptional regulator